MLLKATIVHRGRSIQREDSGETISFETCVRRGTSDGSIKFLTEEQALSLRALNGLRDAAQHYLLEVSEGQLYIQIQSAVTLFADLLRDVFERELARELPDRVLPVSTSPPVDISTMFDSDVTEILKLLAPGRRRRIEAEARLRSLVLIDSGIRDKHEQPSSKELGRIGRELANRPWEEIFKGVGIIQVTTEGTGPTLSVRLSKREGPPMQIVDQGTPGAVPVAIRRVNELDFYNLNASQLADKVSLTTPKLIAVVEYLGIRDNLDCYKEIRIDSSLHKRYSQRAIRAVTDALKEHSIEVIWEWNKQRIRQS